MILDPIFLLSLLENIIFFPVFIFAIILAWYIPGSLTLANCFTKKTFVERLTLSTLVGLILWGFQGVVFGYLGLRYLTYFYIAIFLLIWLRRTKFHSIMSSYKFKIFLPNFLKKNYLILLIFLVGIIGQIQAFFITGFTFSDGIHMFSGSSDDSFWHTALINQLVKNFPPHQPGLYPELVSNYHYISNLLVADLIRIFHLPLLPTQYQFIYPLLSLLLGLVAYTLGRSLNLKRSGIIFLIFIQYFASDIMYLLTLVTRKVFEFTVHPLEDGTMFLENPPRAFASIIGLTSVIFLIEFLRIKKLKLGILFALFAGIAIGMKVHHGALLLSGSAGLALYFLFSRQPKLIAYPALALIISTALYLPVNSGAGMPIFVLFDMPRMFFGQEKLGITSLELARQIYEKHSNTLQLTRVYATMLAVFLLAEFGLKNIGFLPLRKTISRLTLPVALYLYSGILTTLVLGTFFIQPIAGADIFNFYLSASLFLSVISAITFNEFMKNKSKRVVYIVICLILIMTIPRWIYKTSSILGYTAQTAPLISYKELVAMEFVKKNTDEKKVILVMNAGQWDSVYPYVSAFTDRNMFLSGQVILGRHGIKFENKEKVVNLLKTTNSYSEFQKTVKDNKISYLYFYGDPMSSVIITPVPGKKIFYNGNITIYQLIK